MDISSFVSGLIMMATSASMTGGVSAGAGETIRTGDSYSSVKVENVINTGSSGGTSKTIIKTNVDGVEHTEVREESFPTSSIIKVIVATSSSSKAKIITENGEASSTVVLEKRFATSTKIVPAFTVRVSEYVSQFFTRIFGWFSFNR